MDNESFQRILDSSFERIIDKVEIPFSENSYRGKVRDSFIFGETRILVATDRLSAFDVVLTTIPFKGQLLNAMATYWLEKTKHLVPNHLICPIHPNACAVKQAKVFPVEVIVRGYLTGSAWRDYEEGKLVSGVNLKKGLVKNQKLDSPIITPSTKEESGKHDIPISEEEIIKKNLVTKDHWEQIRSYALELFKFGQIESEKKGLILVDTKYEFGLDQTEDLYGEVILVDEIHTQDSSRYWILESYQDLFSKFKDPEMLDKEYVRRWLMSKNYMGNSTPPEFSKEFRKEISTRYRKTYETICSKEFEPSITSEEEISSSVESFLAKNKY